MKTANKPLYILLFILTALALPIKTQAQYDTLFYEDFSNPLPNNGFTGWNIGDGPDLFESDGIFGTDTSWANASNTFSFQGIYFLSAWAGINKKCDSISTQNIIIGDSTSLFLKIKGYPGLGLGIGDTLSIYVTLNNTQKVLVKRYIDTVPPQVFMIVDEDIGHLLTKGITNQVKIHIEASTWNDADGISIYQVLLLRPSVSDLLLSSYEVVPYGCTTDSFLVRASFRNVSSLDTVAGFAAELGLNGTSFDSDTVAYVLPPGGEGSHAFGPYSYSLFGGADAVSFGLDLDAFNTSGQWDSNNANDSLWKNQAVKIFLADTLTTYFEPFDTFPSWNANNDSTFGLFWTSVSDSGYHWFVLEKDYGSSPYYSGGLVQGDAPRYGDHTKWMQNFGKFAWLNLRFNSGNSTDPITSNVGASLVSPWINLKNAVAPVYDFWYYSLGVYQGTKVLVETWNCSANTWEIRDSILPPVQSQFTDPWQHKEIPLYDYVGGITRLRFRFVKTSGGGSVPIPSPFFGIDDIRISDTALADVFARKVFLPQNQCFSDSESVAIVLGNNTLIAYNDSLPVQVKTFLNNTLLRDTTFKALVSVSNTQEDTLLVSYFDFSSIGNYRMEISFPNFQDTDTSNNSLIYRFVHLSQDSARKFLEFLDFEAVTSPYSPIGNYYQGWEEGLGTKTRLEELQNHSDLRYLLYPYGTTRCATFSASSQASYLITPAIIVPDSGSYLSFSYDLEQDSTISLQILWSEDCGRNWKLLKSYPSDTTNTWKNDTLHLDSLQGKTLHFSFVMSSETATGNTGYLDNIKLFQKYRDLASVKIEDLTQTYCWGEDTLYFTYKNTGYYDFTTNDTVTLTLKVGDSVYIQNVSTSLLVGDSLKIPFVITLPRDTVTNYDILGIVTWVSDEMHSNDTLQGSLSKYEPFVIVPPLLSQDSILVGDSLYLSGNLSGYYTHTEWSVNDSVISTDTTAWFTTNTEGLYVIELSVSACNDTLTARDSLYVVASGLAFIELTGVKVYPNPTEGKLLIEINFRYGRYELHSLSGQFLEGGKLEKGKNLYDLRGRPSGIYLLHIFDREGRRKIYKVVKR